MKKTALFLTLVVSFLHGNDESYGKVLNFIRGIVGGQVEEGFFHNAFDEEYKCVFEDLVKHCIGGRFSSEVIEAFIANKRAFLEEHEQGGIVYRCLCEEVKYQVDDPVFHAVLKGGLLTQ